MKQVKAYSFWISTDEQYEDIQTGARKSNLLINAFGKAPEFIGVHPDPQGRFVAFLFKTEKGRNQGFEKAKEIGFISAVPISAIAYIDEKFVKENENDRS